MTQRIAGLAVLSVVPLRGHALTYLAGGPAIATLTAVLLLSWRTWTEVTSPGPLAAGRPRRDSELVRA